MMVRSIRKHPAALCALAFFGALFVILFVSVNWNPGSRPASTGSADVGRALSVIRVPFQENAGQFPKEVAYAARMFAGSVFVTREGGILYSLVGRHGDGTGSKTRYIKESLVGGKPLSISGEDPSSARVSRFFGNDPAKWIRDIKAWDTVRFDQVYEGVDVRLKARGGSVEKVFHVRPGADPSAIRLLMEGADRLAVNERGELEAGVGGETVRFTSPVAWQEDDGGNRMPVAAAYEIAGNEYGFRLAGYDPGREVIIDPLLAATYLGGTASPTPPGDAAFDDKPYSISFDASGNLYVAGATGSSDFPASPGYDGVMNGTTDAYVVKLSPNLQLMAATFLGGNSEDMATAVQVRGSYVYVVGSTKSRDDFPTVPGSYIQRGYDWDVFVVRLNLSLSTLSAGAILGGSFSDNEVSMALDASGNVFVSGRTESDNFPVTAGVFDNISELSDMGYQSDFFVSKLDANLSSASYVATFLGGTTGGNAGCEATPSIAIDRNGNVVLTGLTEATDYPMRPGAFDNAYGSGWPAAVVVSKLSGDLGTLLASTFVGPSDLKYRGSLSLDAGDNVLIGGYASASTFPTSSGAHRPASDYLLNEGFVAKLDNTLSYLLASTLVGGNGNDFVTGIFAASDGSVYVTGQTDSGVNFEATPGAFDTTFNGVLDVFVRRYSGDLTTRLYSTFLLQGSTPTNTPQTFLALDNGYVYVAGMTKYPSILTTAGVVQENFNHPYSNNYYDGFIAKFTSDLSTDSTAPTVSPVSPTSGATGVPVDNAVQVIFSERMNPSTITGSSFYVSAGGTQVPGTVAFNGVRIATFTPTDNLAIGTTYTVTVTTGVQDYWGIPMASIYTFTFTTVGAPGSTSRSSGGCTVPVGRNETNENGWPAIAALLSPLAFILAVRVRVRRRSGKG